MKASSLAAVVLMSAGCATQAPTVSQVPKRNPTPQTDARVTAENATRDADRSVAAGPMGQPMGQPSGGTRMAQPTGATRMAQPSGGTTIRRGGTTRTRGRALPPTTFMNPGRPVPLGPWDVTPGRAPRNQAEWDYVLARLSWEQRMSLINQAKQQLGMQPSVFPPYTGQPASTPIDPWSGRGSFRGAPDASFLPPVQQPVPTGGR